ncbi:MarR family winged helix-turn-helix transcriptional regulator [Clostridium gasigenes]|uniref:MarR family protein n=1 Tax=Clostridium gasigenes TaxID=94869 RepID=A0A1H0LT91_9CLOT|nr:MarR family transcriptional regulator [Clostridium gasigenes]SDO71251.1 MarR family protein [Clostridium gasigenes]
MKSNLDINNSQARILFVLSKFKELNINKLVQELSLSKSTLTSMLDRLEKLGYLKKKSNHLDKRETIINITEDGEKIAETYNSIVDEMSLVYICQVSAQTKLLLDKLYPLTEINKSSHKPRFGKKKLIMGYTQAASFPFLFRSYFKYTAKHLKGMGLEHYKTLVARKMFNRNSAKMDKIF